MMLLAGDIGATTTRLALVCSGVGPRKFVAEEEFPSVGFKGLQPIVERFLGKHRERPEAACFDVAGPVIAGRAHLTNLSWDLEEGALCRDLGLGRITLLNDLEAIAHAVPHLQPGEIRNTLGVAVGQATYQAYRDLLESDRFQRLQNLGARPQRLLFASTGTKDKSASDTLYVDALAAPNTVNTMPEDTLKAYADHGPEPEPMPRDGGSASKVLAAHADAGIDPLALAAQLQTDGAKGFAKSWRDLLAAIDAKSKVVA
jgi:hypothetical protein